MGQSQDGTRGESGIELRIYENKKKLKKNLKTLALY